MCFPAPLLSSCLTSLPFLSYRPRASSHLSPIKNELGCHLKRGEQNLRILKPRILKLWLPHFFWGFPLDLLKCSTRRWLVSFMKELSKQWFPTFVGPHPCLRQAIPPEHQGELLCCPVPAPRWLPLECGYSHICIQTIRTLLVTESRMFETGMVLEFPELWWSMTMEGNVVSIISGSCYLPKLPPFTSVPCCVSLLDEVYNKVSEKWSHPKVIPESILEGKDVDRNVSVTM